MIGDGHPLVKPPRDHLSPTGPGLFVLVNHRGVAAEEDGHGRSVGFYDDAFHRRCSTVELQRQRVVPVEIPFLPLLDFHLHLVVNARRALVDHETVSGEFSFLRRHFLQEEATALCAHHRFGSTFLGTQCHRHLVIPVRHSH